MDTCDANHALTGAAPASTQVTMAIDWEHYDTGAGYDELVEAPGRLRAPARPLCRYLGSLTRSEIEERKNAAELAIMTWASPSRSIPRRAAASIGPGPSTYHPAHHPKS